MAGYWPRSFFYGVIKDLHCVSFVNTLTGNLVISQYTGRIYQYAIQTEETTASSELSVVLKESQLTGGRSVGCL